MSTQQTETAAYRADLKAEGDAVATDLRMLERAALAVRAGLWPTLTLLALAVTATAGVMTASVLVGRQQPATVVTVVAPAPTAYDRCEAALRVAWALWQHNGAEYRTPECDQPTVTYEQYQRAYRAVGGEMWTAVAHDEPAVSTSPAAGVSADEQGIQRQSP